MDVATFKRETSCKHPAVANLDMIMIYQVRMHFSLRTLGLLASLRASELFNISYNEIHLPVAMTNAVNRKFTLKFSIQSIPSS